MTQARGGKKKDGISLRFETNKESKTKKKPKPKSCPEVVEKQGILFQMQLMLQVHSPTHQQKTG